MDFVEQIVADLLLIAQHTAEGQQTNRSRAARPSHHQRAARKHLSLPEAGHRYRTRAHTDRIVPEPEFDLPYRQEVEARLPAIAGGLSYAVARRFKIIDPEIKHLATEA
jgi:Domain of unknown function (DUF1931)